MPQHSFLILIILPGLFVARVTLVVAAILNIEIATMACHTDAVATAHTYSSCINMFHPAHKTSFLSINSVSEEPLHYRTFGAVAAAEFFLFIESDGGKIINQGSW